MYSQLQSTLLGSFITTVMMVMFSWIGLSEIHALRTPDSLDLLHNPQADSSKLPQSLLPEIRKLEQASRYHSRLIGVGASLSEQFMALEKIKSNSQSESILEYLLTHENPVAQLFGLKGLKDQQSSLYEQYHMHFLNSNKHIEMQSGCSVYEDSISQAVKTFDKN